MIAPGTPSPDVRASLSRELDRVVERLRHLSLDRLAQPAPPWPSRLAAAYETAQLLAGAAQDIEERDDLSAPCRRELPELAPHGSADQLAVTGHDLLRALAAVEDAAGTWLDGGRSDAGTVAARACEALVGLRRAV